MDQNLNHYRIFYEVAKHGNISKAADALFISQPAVSKSISRLEQSLHHTLFLRSKKGVRLTEEGKILFEHLRNAFDSINTAERMLKRMETFGMGQLRIGVSTSLCKHILLPYLQDFIKEHPHVKVSIECNSTFETLELLKKDKIDIGLVCETPLDKGYHFLPLRFIHDTFVTTQTYLDNLFLREAPPIEAPSEKDSAENYPAIAGLLMFAEPSKKPSPPPFSQKEILEKANLMLLDKDNISRIFIEDYFTQNHIHPGQILEINNMDLLIDFAAIGMGVAGVVREFINAYLENGHVIEIPLDYEIPERTVGFVYAEQGVNTTAGEFLDFCTR